MWEKIVQWMVTKRGAWITVVVMSIIGLGVAGGLRGFSVPNTVGALPNSAEAAVVSQLAKKFPHADESQVLAVFTASTKGETLSAATLQEIKQLGTELEGFGGPNSTSEVFGPIAAENEKAALLSIPIQTKVTDAAGELTPISNGDMGQTIDQIRQQLQPLTPEGTQVWITGGPAFGANIAAAFDGANFTLLAVTIGIVALLLLLTYRSPVLWLIPLTVVALADGAAGSMTAMTGELSDLGFDSGIISVLVFGAGTNYALLLISRYREELRKNPDHRAALQQAVVATTPPIVASNLTVVSALATLLLGIVPSTRGLGLAAAVGLVFALIFVLTLLPALLSLVGRKVFWPFVPKPDDAHATKQSKWFTVANTVVRFRLPVLITAVAALVLMALPLLGTSVGLSKTEQFRVPSESAAGFQILQDNFPAGEAEPFVVMSTPESAETLMEALAEVAGVERVGQLELAADGSMARFSVVVQPEPDTPEANQVLEELRLIAHGDSDVDSLNTDTTAVLNGEVQALIGGAAADSYDLRQASAQDLLLIAPLVLLISFIVLVVLLRALLGPVVLLLMNVLSALAAIGAGSWVGTTFFDFPALDVNVPLLAFIFLVALGIDYTIFLAHRTQLEAAQLPIRQAVAQAIGHTGVVITSAGVVLAAVFAALGVLPLVTLGQLGLIVSLGVLLDTLAVRSIVVPAAIALLGELTWWPNHKRPAADSSLSLEQSPRERTPEIELV